jgi:hypothetical protein
MNNENLRPPKHGEPSRNPFGRPKGSRNRSTIVKEWLSVQQKIKNPITGTIETLDQADMITLALISKARKGDVAAFKELMDSGFGKIKDVQDSNVTVNSFSIKDIYAQETQEDLESTGE